MKRRNGTIYFSTEVDVDVDVDVSDVIEEITDDELIEELKDRGLEKELRPSIGNSNFSYRSLCDLFGVNYFIKIDKLTEMLNKKLKSEL